MKKRNDVMTLVFVITIGILMMVGFSCARQSKDKDNNYLETGYKITKDNVPERIHPLEFNFRTNLSIVEVDGHEYLVEYEGGIYHLESCPCKNK